MLPRHRWNWISRLFFSLLLCRQAWKCHFLLLLRAFSRSSFKKKKEILDYPMNWVRRMIWVDIIFKKIVIEILRGFRYYWSMKLFFRFSNNFFPIPKAYISSNSTKSFILKHIFINFYPHKFATYIFIHIPFFNPWQDFFVEKVIQFLFSQRKFYPFDRCKNLLKIILFYLIESNSSF